MKVYQILDIYSDQNGINVWLYNEKERIHIKKPYQPFFYFRKNESVKRLLQKKFKNIKIVKDIKIDLIDGEIEVYKVIAKNPLTYNKIISFIKYSDIFTETDFYNIQLSPETLFMFEKKIYPFCKLEKTEKNGRCSFKKIDDLDLLDYEILPLRIMYIDFELEIGKENLRFLRHIPTLTIKFNEDEKSIVIDNDLEYLQELLIKKDPDIIIANYGDDILIPNLFEKGLKFLNRDNLPVIKKEGKSFVSYGQTVYTADVSLLLGRIHIDPKNSFFYKEVGLDGIIELSRISSLGMQAVARTTIGTPITYMEMRNAYENNFLIPYKKNQPEDFKTLEQLIKIDKGGLTLKPLVGLFENVAEYDFFSMYPSIITNYNLSYETINCKHPECEKTLPYTNYRICTKKIGIVPQTLKWLLERRLKYKQLLKKEKNQIYDNRQKALKWLLVVSFGYLGYKNAVFGRIESHEATTSIGRQLITFVKEILEAKGFRVVHILTDSIWVYKHDYTMDDYKKMEEYLNKRINEKFTVVNPDGIPFKILLEGVYDWIVFLPSKSDSVGVSNRYFGKFSNGEFKFRGIDLRRRDVPEFIKNFQLEVFEHLSKGKNKTEFLKLIKDIDEIFNKHKQKLLEGDFSLKDLIIKKKVSKDPNSYQKRTDLSEVAGTLLKEGFNLNPGESVNIIYILDKFVKAMPLEIYLTNPKPINIEKYLKMLEESKIGLLPKKLFGNVLR